MCGPLLLGGLGLLVAELYLLMAIGAHIGPFVTLLLIFGTAAAGLPLVRGQGLTVLRKLQTGVPAQADRLEGPLLILAALCLLLPGFITDATGALLLLPPIRRAAARYLADRFGKGGGGDGTIIVIR